MPQPHSALGSALAHLCESNRALRRCLEQNEGVLLEAHAMTSGGVNASAILKEIPFHAAQTTADEAMMALFEARDRVRKIVVCEALEDGMTVEQLATMFHLSPDLISAYVAEGSNKFFDHTRVLADLKPLYGGPRQDDNL